MASSMAKLRIDDLQDSDANESDDVGTEGSASEAGTPHGEEANNVHATQSAASEGAVTVSARPPLLCGVGLSFMRCPSGDIKITGIMPGSPAYHCDVMQVGDVMIKVDGASLVGKSREEIVDMILGPPGSSVQLTIQSQYGYPYVMTAPFQALPFDTSQKKKRKGFGSRRKSEGEHNGFTAPENRLYGGGTLPKGFEHLESLRSAQPYTTPSLSVRTVTLPRQLPAPSMSQAVHEDQSEELQRQLRQQQQETRTHGDASSVRSPEPSSNSHKVTYPTHTAHSPINQAPTQCASEGSGVTSQHQMAQHYQTASNVRTAQHQHQPMHQHQHQHQQETARHRASTDHAVNNGQAHGVQHTAAVSQRLSSHTSQLPAGTQQQESLDQRSLPDGLPGDYMAVGAPPGLSGYQLQGDKTNSTSLPVKAAVLASRHNRPESLIQRSHKSGSGADQNEGSNTCTGRANTQPSSSAAFGTPARTDTHQPSTDRTGKSIGADLKASSTGTPPRPSRPSSGGTGTLQAPGFSGGVGPEVLRGSHDGAQDESVALQHPPARSAGGGHDQPDAVTDSHADLRSALHDSGSLHEKKLHTADAHVVRDDAFQNEHHNSASPRDSADSSSSLAVAGRSLYDKAPAVTDSMEGRVGATAKGLKLFVGSASSVPSSPVPSSPHGDLKWGSPKTKGTSLYDAKKGAPPRPPPPSAMKPPSSTIMLSIAGVKHVVVSEVAVCPESLHSSLVCVLWVPNGEIYYWNGGQTVTMQRVKGLELCNSIKDIEHGARAKIIRMEEAQEDEVFWGALGGRPSAKVFGSTAPQDPAILEKRVLSETVLVEFLTSGDGARIQMDGPLRRGVLRQDGCYVIMQSGRRVYVWVGRVAPKECADAATAHAAKLSAVRTRASFVPATPEQAVDGWEGTLFRSLFVDWITACGTTAKLRDESDSPIAVDSSVIARRTNAVLVSSGLGDALFQVKGKKLVAVREVALSVASISHASVFVLNTKGCVYQWNGLKSNPQEKTKAADLCLSLRDHDHGGRAGIKVLDADGIDTRDGAVFWGKLEGQYTAFKGGADDAEFEERARQAISLLHVSSADDTQGKVMPRPYRHSSLQSDAAFVLLWDAEQLFVWTGNTASQELKEAAFWLASKIQKDWVAKGINIGIQAAPQHGEPALFRAHFQGWQQGGAFAAAGKGERTEERGPAGMVRQVSDGSSAKDKSTVLLEERAALVDIEQIEAQGPLQEELITPAVKHDDGSTGTLQVWRVVNGKLHELKSDGGEADGQCSAVPLVLASVGCYVLCYSFCPGVDRTQVRHVLYAWQGCMGTKQDIAAAALCLQEVGKRIKGQGMQDKQVVVDSKESPHFLIACGGVFIVVNGLERELVLEGRMFEARFVAETAGVCTGKAVEVLCKTSVLYSGSCFIVLLAGAQKLAGAGKVAAYVWRGAYASETDSNVAKAAVKRLLHNAKAINKCVVHVDEGSEPAELWKTLGGFESYRRLQDSVRDGDRVTRLFHVEMAGLMVRPREISLPVREDLEDSPSGACLVDFHDAWGAKVGPPGCVYVWHDDRCNKTRLQACITLAKRYIEARNARLGTRQSLPPEPRIEVSGRESSAFTGLFHAWIRTAAQQSMHMASASPLGPKTADSPERKPVILKLEELLGPRDKLPAGVNPEAREDHLTDADFESAFGCSRSVFASFPAWKKTTKRREAGLF